MSEEGPVEETNPQTKRFVIGAIAVVMALILFIFFGLPASRTPNVPTMEYNYFTFKQVGGMWETTIELDGQSFNAPFRFNPEQVENVSIEGNFTGFVSQPVYVTFDPESEDEEFRYLALASSELSLHMVRALNVSVEAACTKNVTIACQNRSVVRCGDRGRSVVYLVAEGEPELRLRGSCVELRGEGLDILKSVDRMLYQWYRIMR